jgi:hypothetical protein
MIKVVHSARAATRRRSLPLNSESLTYWYFRLNGFFTIPNFVVHPDRGSKQRTDIDVFGIRLPNRHELIADPMEDDGVFTQVGDKAFLAIVEVKADLIAFNRTWTVPELKNVQRFLAAAGAFAPDKVEAIAHELYARGCFTADPFYHVSLVGIGRRLNPKLQATRPVIPQITWDNIARFIFRRFNRYAVQKRSHVQWDDAGKQLWDVWQEHQYSQGEFCDALLAIVTESC